MFGEEYAIRYAAGCYWIVKTGQQSEEYIPPVMTNLTGCIIWKDIQKDMDKKSIVEHISALYGITKDEAERDTDEFIENIVKAFSIEGGIGKVNA